MMRSHRGVLPLAAVEAVIGRAFAIGPDAQEAAERIDEAQRQRDLFRDEPQTQKPVQQSLLVTAS